MFKVILPVIGFIIAFLLTINISEDLILFYMIIHPLNFLLVIVFPQIIENTSTVIYKITSSREYFVGTATLFWFIIGSGIDGIRILFKRKGKE